MEHNAIITSFMGVSTRKVFPLNRKTGKYSNIVQSSDPKLNGTVHCEYTLEYMLKNTPTCYLVHTISDGKNNYVVSGEKTEFFVVVGEPTCPLDDGPVIRHFQDESGRTGDDDYGGTIKHFRD